MTKSRIEKILENILGSHNSLLPPFSRNEVLLTAIMDELEGVPDESMTDEEITAIINSMEV